MAKKREQDTTNVRLGHGKTYQASVSVRGGGACRLEVRRDDDPDATNFPISISLTRKDALKLAAAICERIAIFN